ncbi:unnamed protein product [Discosporangium mesarthrocarpum]
MGVLLAEAHQVSQAVVMKARVLLFRALSSFLLPEKILVGGLSQVGSFDGRAQAYSAMVVPLLRPIVEASEGWQEWQRATQEQRNSQPWEACVEQLDLLGVTSSCRILSGLCGSLTGTPSKVKRVLKEAMSPALAIAASLVPPLLSPLSTGATSKELTGAASSLLELQVVVIQHFGQEVGSEFSVSAVEALSLATAGRWTGSGTGAGATTAQSHLMVYAATFRLLLAVVGARSARLKTLVPQVCQLALGRLESVGAERLLDGPALEIMPDFLKLVKMLLVTQWHCFTTSSLPQATSIASALPPGHAQKKTLANENMAEHFNKIMTVLHLLLTTADQRGHSPFGPMTWAGLGAGIQEQQGPPSVPPDVARLCLEVLDEADHTVGLFRFTPFSDVWLETFLTDALLGLGEGEHPTLQEEIRSLVFRLAEVDHEAFACKFLRTFLTSFYPRLGEAERETLLAPWQAGSHMDAPTFSSFLEAFFSDLAFLRSQMSSGGGT